MEATRAEKTRLGVFILLTGAALTLSVFFLIGRKLMAKTDIYFTRLEESVTGISLGSPVKQNGVDIGEISFIGTDSTNIRMSIVTIKVNRGTPMKTDMVASLGSYGITGLKYLEITGGSYSSPNLTEGGEIRSRLSMMGRVILQADSIAAKIDLLLGNAISMTEAGSRQHINKLLESSASLSISLDSLARDFQKLKPGQRIEHILSGTELAVSDLREKIRKTDVPGTMEEYRKAAQDMQKVAQSMDATVRRTQEDLAISMTNLKDALKNMSTFSRQIKDNPSILLRGEDKQERRP